LQPDTELSKIPKQEGYITAIASLDSSFSGDSGGVPPPPTSWSTIAATPNPAITDKTMFLNLLSFSSKGSPLLGNPSDNHAVITGVINPTIVAGVTIIYLY